ncbi:hypothetical protein LCGC14_1196620 [marine sediment metagenome]|uniref:Uncharacterized protein n=1 Tax=marine sediment metagenome TaxID=412755 RepID=A0A0F9LIC2_9ZZZZ
MAVCEKCWAEAGGIFEKYLELLKQRDCTPQEQVGHGKGVQDAKT